MKSTKKSDAAPAKALKATKVKADTPAKALKAAEADAPAKVLKAAKPKADAPAKVKASAKKAPLMPQIPAPDVVVLPQSQNKVFLIWRAQPELDQETDSWVIRTSFGEKARVPAASRSVFLTGSGAFHVDIFRVLKDGTEELFLSKTTKEEEYSSQAGPSENGGSPQRLNSSSQNFRRRISS